MSIQIKLLTVLLKKFGLLSRKLGVGAGATWPGEIALRLRPDILKHFSSLNIKIILVAGTNGKTTTVKMIETILTHAGKKIAHNASGANLDNGLVSAFLADASWLGKLKSEYFIFEVDEATLPNILKSITPHTIVLLNLFRDQLDRYGEVDIIAEKWMEALSSFWQVSLRTRPESLKKDAGQASMTAGEANLIINADDPQLVYIGEAVSSGSALEAGVTYFGLEDSSLFLPSIQHATDSIYCPRCGQRLTFGGVYYSHLGKWSCGSCGLTHPKVDLRAKDFASPVAGIYNKYNTLAAASVCRSLGATDEKITEGLSHFIPAFGRMETLEQGGKSIKILLSKNPTGFNESLRTAFDAKARTLLLVLNDRIPDGRDVSWIWDVDFEVVNKKAIKIFISGDRCYDLALRIKYAGIGTDNYSVHPNIQEGIDASLAKVKVGETLWVLPTYSAMLETRKILIGRKIL